MSEDPMSLQRLSTDAARLVTPALAAGQQSVWGASDLRTLAGAVTPTLALGPLDAALDAAVAATPRFDAALDRILAPAVHRALPLSRRQASDAGVWRWLAVVHRPDVVRHRYENRSWAAMRSRFWSVGTRPDSIPFARWWWIAELSRDGEDYTLTERLFARQPLVTPLFVREFSWHRPLVQAFVERFEDAPPTEIERACRALSTQLALRVLAALSPAECETLVASVA